MNDLIKELKWRGLYKDSTDLEKLTNAVKNKDAFYLGIDPTATSIHIGHMLSINLTRILNKYGMKPVLLVGGATASIGDPSGKSEERKMLNNATLTENINSITNQLEEIVEINKNDFGNDFKLLNNWSWYQNMDLIRFLRDYGKLINVASMISKDNVKKRIETGISYTEFSYQMLQAFDWTRMYEDYGVKLQIGGSDQWGNIVTGTEMIRKSLGAEDAVGMTVELLLDKSGNKIGKTSKGEVIWMDEELTSSYKLYQYIRNQNDEMAQELAKKLTLISEEEFNDILEKHNKEPKKRLFQNYVAKHLIAMLGHKVSYDSVLKVSEIIFSGSYSELSEDEMEVMSNEMTSKEIKSFKNIKLIELLEENNLINSRRELREQLANKTVYINERQVLSEDEIIDGKDIMFGKYVILRLSKKNRIILKTREG